MSVQPWTELERDIARAVCSDYAWDFDALSPQTQAYWLRLARRFCGYLTSQHISLDTLTTTRRAA